MIKNKCGGEIQLRLTELGSNFFTAMQLNHSLASQSNLPQIIIVKTKWLRGEQYTLSANI